MTLGLPRMHKEQGERRDFLPSLVRAMASIGVEVVAESGIGSGMGFSDDDYASVDTATVRIADNAAAFRQDIVLVLRPPELTEFDKLRRGSMLLSMLHFPTRPRRIRRLRELGVEAVGLDTIVDDEGQRLVENMVAVAWNGVEAAFTALASLYPQLGIAGRRPIRVTVLGTGQVGRYAVDAATKYGDRERAERLARIGVPGVEVAAVGRNLTYIEHHMRDLFKRSDILVDATRRRDPSIPVIPNAWIRWLPDHAIICDLNVDPYLPHLVPPVVRSVEGIPQGTLDQYVFDPCDDGWERTVPAAVPSAHRRTVVSCYSWPGIHPDPCMEHYERQFLPVLETLVHRGGIRGIRRRGDFFERALWRGSLGARAQEASGEGGRADLGEHGPSE